MGEGISRGPYIVIFADVTLFSFLEIDEITVFLTIDDTLGLVKYGVSEL